MKNKIYTMKWTAYLSLTNSFGTGFHTHQYCACDLKPLIGGICIMSLMHFIHFGGMKVDMLDWVDAHFEQLPQLRSSNVGVLLEMEHCVTDVMMLQLEHLNRGP